MAVPPKNYELETECGTLQSRTRVALRDRRGCRDVFTGFSHRDTIRRGITARGKLIVRYNSHNSKHLKCQPELIVAMRSCDEAECGESYPNKSLSLFLSSPPLFLSLCLSSRCISGGINPFDKSGMWTSISLAEPAYRALSPS